MLMSDTMAVLATPLTVGVSVFAAGAFVTSVPVTLARAPPLATRAVLKPVPPRKVVSVDTPDVCAAVLATFTLKSTFTEERRPAETAVMVTSAAVTPPPMPAAITSLKLVRTAPTN